jgi:hypothetical protein
MHLPVNVRHGLSAALAAVCLGACAVEPAKVPKPPVMPTVSLAPVAPTHAAPAELVAQALRLALAGNLAGAQRMIEGVPDPALRAEAGTGFIAALAESSPALVASVASTWRASQFRTSDVEVAARSFARANPAAALAWALGITEATTAAAARRTVAIQLADRDPRGALEQLAALPASEAREMTLGFLVAAWARRDAAAAEEWVRARPESEARQRLLLSVAFEVAQSDPKRAIALAEVMPAGRDRWLLLAASSQTWVAQDHASAMAWVNQLPAGEAREAALAGVTAGLGAGSRRVAGVTGLRGLRGRNRVGGTAMLPDLASPAFAAWLATQPAGLSREEAMLEYVRQRATVEPLVVGQWIASLPGGTSRDQAIDVYLAASDPATAARWLQSLARSDRTNERLERTAEQWLRTNPGAAAAWLAETNLPPERKEWLLRQLGK